MKRRGSALVAALVSTLAVVASPGAPASAEEPPVEVGWWTSNPTASAPDRGLAVSAGPSGTITSAALRAPVDGASIDTATLTLTEEGGVQQAGAQLKVCATPNAWTSGPKQPSDKAPKPECDRAGAPLARNANGTWTADVKMVLSSPLAGDPTSPSLMIVPAGNGAVPVGFEVRFQPPRLEVTRRAGPSSAPSSSTSSDAFADFDSPEPASAPASGPSSSSSSSSSSSFSSAPSRSSSSSFEGPPLASFSPAQLSGTIEDAPTAQDTAATEVLAAAPEPVAVAATQARVVSSTAPASGSRTVQAIFFIVVATLVGIGVGFGHARFRPEGATS